MLPSTTLHPLITTNSPEFCNLWIQDDQCHELAYQLIESYPFIGQTATVHNSRGGSFQTTPVIASQVESIKKYLKAFIDVDRSALEIYFSNFNAAEAKRRMVHEIIDRRQELYLLYVEYQRDVVERTRARTALPSESPSPMTPQIQTRVASLPRKVNDRDGGVCRVTGVGSEGYWEDRAAEQNVGFSCFMPCEVTHGMSWSVDQPYWELVRRLLGVSAPSASMDVAQNAMLLQTLIHRKFQNYMLYFDPGFKLRRRALGRVHLSSLLGILHVRQGVGAVDGGFLNLPILPCQTNPSVPDVDYAYFLLHKLILFTWLEEPRRWD
ncbi:hypothetical protein FIBSPDRAFT_1042756 [Athelia psychrophila]|uniref:HNH nuclease domain-containing protein n=1 Tax=Athelia psychrophila TaxID=1759441 RepID=A0A166M382_9AGAM|nr:hypothetical protein FIBSPDRAFT_1042756 [Fibularhizoctonia sp. CBS 109695]